MSDKIYGPPKKKKRQGSVNPLGKRRGDVYRDTRRPDSPQKGAKGQADVPTAKQKEAVANIAAIGGGAMGKSLMSATRSAMTARSIRKAKHQRSFRMARNEVLKLYKKRGGRLPPTHENQMVDKRLTQHSDIQ
jgi:hypothetical protein